MNGVYTQERNKTMPRARPGKGREPTERSPSTGVQQCRQCCSKRSGERFFFEGLTRVTMDETAELGQIESPQRGGSNNSRVGYVAIATNISSIYSPLSLLLFLPMILYLWSDGATIHGSLNANPSPDASHPKFLHYQNFSTYGLKSSSCVKLERCCVCKCQ